VAQVRLRAERLGLAGAQVGLAAETAVEDIVATLSEGETPRLLSSTPSRPCDRHGRIRTRHRDTGRRGARRSSVSPRPERR
jgi:hypothetical protein